MQNLTLLYTLSGFGIGESLKRMEISREGFLKIHHQAENSRQLNKTVS